VVPLGADVLVGIALAPVELVEHLVGGVAAPRAVAHHLPPAAQALGRVEEDADVEAFAERVGVVAEQAFNDQEAPRGEVDGRCERAVRVPVDRLNDGLAAAQQHQVLAHDVHVVAARVERRQAHVGALRAVVAVVVVEADVRDLLLAQHAHQPPRQCRLAARGVAHDAKDDRA